MILEAEEMDQAAPEGELLDEKNSVILSRGLALDQLPSVQQALSGQIGFR